MATSHAADEARRRRLAASGGWIGVDLDGTLAEYGGWSGPASIGKPVPKMLERVKAWLAADIEVRIVTARAKDAASIEAVQTWCKRHLGQQLQVTREKDFAMIELWDDRAVQVVMNTGVRADGLP
jgi:hypothetical protein